MAFIQMPPTSASQQDPAQGHQDPATGQQDPAKSMCTRTLHRVLAHRGQQDPAQGRQDPVQGPTTMVTLGPCAGS
ncbi:hypothetical protein HaLaN_33018 [Haematococcus lacustris]|uniref:Uncharacterized protein n=1 Tax=Haematococcus lacustris TaxID=44745 RepID=A0A6A0AL41_HAELA|nr:hypothetical protein HaLaN_33018 [Haematococcus lacustris]